MANNHSAFFPDRIARAQFLIRSILLFAAALFGNRFLEFPEQVHSSVARIGLLLCACMVLGFCVFCLFRSILIPRLLDAGLHGAWSALILVPFLNGMLLIALLFVPSDGFVRQPPGL